MNKSIVLGVALILGCSQRSKTAPTPSGTTQQVCEPQEGLSIAADCGRFVRDAGVGTGERAAPAGSLATVLADATTKKVFICGAPQLQGSVAFSGGVSLFGGFDCDTWTYSSKRPHPAIVGESNVPALVITGADAPSRIVSIDVIGAAANAVGASSIAILARFTELSIENATLISQRGAAGADGAFPPAALEPAPDGGEGSAGCGATSNSANFGGPGENVCGLITVSGGMGGPGEAGGSPQSGVDGQAGYPGVGVPGLHGGPGGSGQVFSGPQCEDGSNGINGVHAPVGLTSDELGVFAADGFAPGLGRDGEAGGYGTGAGGGGGSISCASHAQGPSGGGGGAGGCGGPGGKAGGVGGAAFALYAFSAHVTLTDVVLIGGDGGAGGKGGDAQRGQIGGAGGSYGDSLDGLSRACNGGAGGNGGRGGPAAGARGGPSALIARTADALVERSGSDTSDVLGAGGAGGPGGMVGDGLLTLTVAPSGPVGPSCVAFNLTTSGCYP